jgi:hypothetical protein
MNYKTDINEAAKIKLLNIGFRIWEDDTMLLIPIRFLHKIPDGTKLKTIMGKTKIKGIDYIDKDTRWGVLSVGIVQEDYNKILQILK